MRRQQTILWTGISVMTGAICLGAAEPQHSKAEPGVPSVGARQGLDGAPMVLIPAGPFTRGVTTTVGAARGYQPYERGAGSAGHGATLHDNVPTLFL